MLTAEFRRQLKADTGHESIARLEDGEVRTFAPERAIARTQDIVRNCIPRDRLLVPALFEERRAEAGIAGASPRPGA